MVVMKKKLKNWKIQTENMWTYILLDKFTGKLWQCQYSVEGTEYISSWVINPNVLYIRKK